MAIGGSATILRMYLWILIILAGLLVIYVPWVGIPMLIIGVIMLEVNDAKSSKKFMAYAKSLGLSRKEAIAYRRSIFGRGAMSTSKWHKLTSSLPVYVKQKSKLNDT
jgi:hypothetical protein